MFDFRAAIIWRSQLCNVFVYEQAAYFVRHGFCRRDKRSNMLLVICFTWKAAQHDSIIAYINFPGNVLTFICSLLCSGYSPTWINFFLRINHATVVYGNATSACPSVAIHISDKKSQMSVLSFQGFLSSIPSSPVWQAQGSISICGI